ncbi:BREX system P-loop protein BrxC, partial [Thiolapillus sp.]|uniref:BREX system P-loop protein BrxC n=1 Tax=Thiolapillus sp. TaxID=2017437 RepID=UPI003AF47517
LKSQIQSAVLQAENNLDDAFAIQLLKELFLVKYVREFKATIRNLCVLMTDSFDQDLPQLHDRVEGALNLLEQQTYIQRTGEIYEYLTDEEKDVEEEIKNTEVETADVAGELEKIIFDRILKNRKIRYDQNGQDYPFSRKLDDRLYGREQELAIHVISPFHEQVESVDILRMHSMGRDELLVIMPAEERLIRDLGMYKKTEKYIRQNISTTQQDAIRRILSDKGVRNQERYADIQQSVKTLLGQARLIVAGADVDVGGEDPQSRITKGFYELIERTYPNLSMLRGIEYKESDVSRYLEGSGLDLGDNLSEQEQEVLAFVHSNQRGGVRTTLKSTLEHFERKPYGWYYAAILCTVAMLSARGKLELRSDSDILEEDPLRDALLNSRGHGNVVLEPQVEFTASQVRNLREFFEDFFDAPPKSTEAKALGKETAEAFAELVNSLERLLTQADDYPFLNVLRPELDNFKEIAGKPYTWFLTELGKQEDELLDLKDDLIGPVQKFMGGSRAQIYKEAKRYLKEQQPNLVYIEGKEVDQIQGILNDPKCFRGNAIQNLKTLYEKLKKNVVEQLDQEKESAKKKLAKLLNRLEQVEEFQQLTSEQQSEIRSDFTQEQRKLDDQQLIAVIRDELDRFENAKYPQLLLKISQWIEPKKPGGIRDAAKEDEEQTIFVSLKSLSIDFDKVWLERVDDVDDYLDHLRSVLIRQIEDGKKVQI